MRLFPIIIIFITLTGCDLKSSEDYHKEANKLEQEGKFKEAIVLLDKAIEKDPNNIKALLDRAVDKSTIEDYLGAIQDYSKVIELDPDNGLAFLNRGKNKKRLEDFKGAIADFDKAISTKGGELIYMDRVENSFVETGFEYDVKMEEIKFERGIAYYRIDSLEKAFDDFNFSIQKSYLLPDSYYWRGLIYLSYQMKDEACKDLSKAMELGDPDAKDLLDKNCN
jgi:tetratricopeptide (TPR) repeat protein